MPPLHLAAPDRAIAVLALLLAAGCAGGSTTATQKAAAAADASGPSSDIAATEAPKLVADPQDKGIPGVSLQGTWLESSKHMQVKVWVHDFPHLLGLAGHLRYDPEALHLTSLKSIGVPAGDVPNATFEARSVAKESPVGRILAGGARFNLKTNQMAAPADVAVSSELWLTLEFEVLKPGNHKVYFDPDSTTALSQDGSQVAAQWGTAHITLGGAK